MIDGPAIRDARNALGLTQQELATEVGVTLRTVGNWERGATVPRDREPKLRSVLGGYLDTAHPSTPLLTRASDAELLGEIARRFARRQPAADAPTDDEPTEDTGVVTILRDAARRTSQQAGDPATQQAGLDVEVGDPPSPED